MTGKNLKCLILLLVLLLVAGAANKIFAQSTSFTYQGRLQDAGTNANGSYDFQFTLWDSLSGGTQQPQPSPETVTKTSVAVANGVFTVQLDFGANAFPGADRFLETGVRVAGSGSFTILSPRQPISSTPYAVRSVSATTADTLSTTCAGCVQDAQINSLAGNKVNGAIPVASVPGGSSSYIQNTTAPQGSSNFNISGNGTAGGSLSGNSVNSTTKYNIGGNTFVATGNGAGVFASTNTFTGFFAGTADTPDPGNGQNGNFNSFFGQGAGQLNSIGFGNSFFGNLAGQANTAGTFNSFFGFQAGNKNTGANNAFVGFDAGFANTTGNGNALFGTSAGSFNKVGNNNSFLGFQAGNGSNGDNNTFLGFQAGGSNITGANNTAIGAAAGVGASNLTNATAIGFSAVVNQSNSLVLGSLNPSTNVGIGTTSPTSRLHVIGDTNLVGNLTVSGTLTAQLPSGNTNYIQNTTSPQGSSNFNISGNGTVGGTLSGTAVNAQAQYNLNGQKVLSTPVNNSNVSVGLGAGGSTTGSFNSFFGSQAGTANAGGFQNSFFGAQAGITNTSGSQNAFFGTGAGASSNANYNSFFGDSAGSANQTGTSNSFFGQSAGLKNLDGVQNTFVGNLAGSNNTSGSGNVIVGEFAGQSNTTEGSNTYVGYAANGTAGINNATAIGANAIVSQSNSLVLGNNVNVGIGTTSPAIALEVRRNGAIASDWQTGQLRISGASDPNMRLSLGYDTSSNLGAIQAGQAFTGFQTLSLNPFGGNVGIGTTSPATKLHVNGVIRLDVLGTPIGNSPLCLNTSNQIAFCNISSLRYKTNVQPFVGGLKVIERLRPITFDWKEGGDRDVGLAAEEVNKVAPLFTFRNNKGEIEGVKYQQLSAVFINAFKEQQTQISQQQEQLKRQQEQIKRQEDQARQQRATFAAQQQQLDALKKLVCRSHRQSAVCRRN